MTWEQVHPAINAALNLTCFVYLVRGRLAIARAQRARDASIASGGGPGSRGDRAAHRRFMLRAFAASTVFLVSYLIRFALSGRHDYPGHGWDRTFYLVMLMSHMVLAMVLVPLVLGALRRALRGDFPAHRKLVKYTWPIWVYVSVTGVLVYVMLYHVAPRLHG